MFSLDWLIQTFRTPRYWLQLCHS